MPRVFPFTVACQDAAREQEEINALRQQERQTCAPIRLHDNSVLLSQCGGCRAEATTGSDEGTGMFPCIMHLALCQYYSPCL